MNTKMNLEAFSMGLIVFLIIVTMFGFCENVHNRRPFYVIGHMVNNIDDLHYFLDNGSNAIEADVTFAANGTPETTFHGIPCDCFRVCDHYSEVTTYLRHVRDITLPDSRYYQKNVSLLMLDLKTSKLRDEVKFNSGREMAKILVFNLFSLNNRLLKHSRLNVVLSVDSTNDIKFIEGFNAELSEHGMQFLHQKIGWEISNPEPLSSIDQMWHKIASIDHIWQSDGITNCLSIMRPLRRLMSLLEARDKCNPERNPYCARKVYQWTIDYKPHFRSALRHDIDGIITNKPWKLREVLEENEFKAKYRLAGPDDNPWIKFL